MLADTPEKPVKMVSKSNTVPWGCKSGNFNDIRFKNLRAYVLSFLVLVLALLLVSWLICKTWLGKHTAFWKRFLQPATKKSYNFFLDIRTCFLLVLNSEWWQTVTSCRYITSIWCGPKAELLENPGFPFTDSYKLPPPKRFQVFSKLFTTWN